MRSLVRATSKDPLGGLLGNLSGVLAGGGVGGLLNGGLGELLERFKQNGQGDAAESWINKGPNKELPPPQLKQAIGPDAGGRAGATNRAITGRTIGEAISRTSFGH